VVSNASLLAWDDALRGAAAGLFLMIAMILIRDRRLTTTRMLGPTLALVAVAGTLWSAPGFPQLTWWSAPLRFLAANGSVLVWLWARAAFDDDFRLRPWHGALWIIIGLLGLSPMLARAMRLSAADLVGQSVSVIALLFAALAGVQTLPTWRADLIAGRRRLRVAVLIGCCVLGIATAAADFLPYAGAGPAAILLANFASALGLCALAVLAGWTVIKSTELQLIAGNDRDQPARAPREAVVDQAELGRVAQMMSVERAYRQEGLTIAALAGKLQLPEYRLRQLINEGLGYRNFNAFLNRYRLDDAKAALGDPEQKDVPVLTIAMDTGFQSIGPFNRAFKADTGVTPTEFRRAALQAAAGTGRFQESASAQQLSANPDDTPARRPARRL
jgi:AraC-like DNA-binding protein